MIKVFYCEKCDKTFYMSAEVDTSCRACGGPCIKFKTTYPEYTSMSLEERAAFAKEQVERAERLRLRRELMAHNHEMKLKDPNYVYVPTPH